MIPADRWKVAQNAELESSRAYEGRRPPTVDDLNQYFSAYFGLDLTSLTGKAILEVGCSPQAAINSMNQTSLRVGLDPLSHAWRRYYQEDTNPVQGMGEFLPFKKDSFDVVLCLNVLDHVDLPRRVLMEMHRCLRKEGVMFVWLQTYATIETIRRALDIVDLPHPHHLEDGDVASLVQELDMEIVVHRCDHMDIRKSVSVIRKGMILSGVKSLLANLLLGLRESSWLLKK